MKNAKDVENPLNLNVLSAIGSIMQCLCQLSWRKTMGQMVKMERKAATKPLILVCKCKLPLFPGSAQAVPLEISRDEWDFCSMHGCSGSCTVRCFTLCTADGSWEVQPRHWSLHTYTHKKNKYIYCVCHQALAELLWEPLTGLYPGVCALHPCMSLAHHMSRVALPAHGRSQISDTKPSGPLLSPFFADSPTDQTHLFPGCGYCDLAEFKSNFLRIDNHWK